MAETDFSAIAERYKNDGELTDGDIDAIADLSLDVLRSLLSFFDVRDATIDEYDGDDGELIFDVSDADVAVLIGRHGKTLEALQTMFALVVSRKLGFRYPVVVDLEGYKSRRKEKVVAMAKSAADRAVSQHKPVRLAPMSAYERRLVHIALRDSDAVDTHSEGVEPERRVVITPID